MKVHFLVLCFILMAPGCSGAFKWLVEKPKVSLENVKVENISLSGATLNFGLKVDNPNPYALDLTSLSYEIEVGGRGISKGNLQESQQIPGRGSKVVWVPVPLTFTDLFASASDFIKKGTQSYRIKGKAKVSSISLPFDHQGEFKLKED